MNKDLEEKYLSIINDNGNVGKTNAGFEFLWLLGGIVGLCLLIFIFADTFANIFIDRMSDSTQIKIEKALSFNKPLKENKKSEKIIFLEYVKPYIVKLDKNLQNKSNFPIYEYDSKDINAFILPDGTIYFTSALLKEVSDRETLTFVLAHELGHYSHRDHLKSVSRDIITSICTNLLTAGQKDLNITVGGITGLSSLKYSRRQEMNADIYANKVVKRLYGTNAGAVKFFKYLDEKEKSPEFLYYFSTHPSTKNRLKNLK